MYLYMNGINRVGNCVSACWLRLNQLITLIMTTHISTDLAIAWKLNSRERLERNVATSGSSRKSSVVVVCDVLMGRSSFFQHFLNALYGFARRFWYAKQREHRIQQTKCCKYEEAYVCAKVIVNRWICGTHSESNKPCERRTKGQRYIPNLGEEKSKLIALQAHLVVGWGSPLAVIDPCWWWMATQAVPAMQWMWSMQR